MSSSSFPSSLLLLIILRSLPSSSRIDSLPVPTILFLLLLMLPLLMFLVFYLVQISSDCRQMLCEVKKLRHRLSEETVLRHRRRIDVIEEQLEFHDGLLQCLCWRRRCRHMSYIYEPFPTAYLWSTYHRHRQLSGPRIHGCFRPIASDADLIAAIDAANKRLYDNWALHNREVFDYALPEFVGVTERDPYTRRRKRVLFVK